MSFMLFVSQLLDFVLHLDTRLGGIILAYGTWTYALLFAIIFCETGLVVLPFLPGDSLLFAAGAFAAQGALSAAMLFVLLAVAAILGDTLNYWIGYHTGPHVFREKSQWFKKEYLDRTRAFFAKHGKKTIILARFVPVIRTFAPFVAGIGRMAYPAFFLYNVIGGIIWVALFTFGGYFFGALPFVKEHFSLMLIAIIVLSFVPLIYELAMHKLGHRK